MIQVPYWVVYLVIMFFLIAFYGYLVKAGNLRRFGRLVGLILKVAFGLALGYALVMCIYGIYNTIIKLL